MKDILVYFLLGLAALGLGLGVASNLDFAKLCFDKTDAESVSYLYVQEAEGGTLVEEASGDYTLTLHDVSESTVVFSDRPVRDAFTMTTAEFVESFDVDFAGDPPNASLSFELATGGAPSVAVFTIDHPIYNEDAGTLSYRVKDIGLSVEDPVELPVSFGAASLFIDTFNFTPIPDPWTLEVMLENMTITPGSQARLSGIVITAGGVSGTIDSDGGVGLQGDGTPPTSFTVTLNGVDLPHDGVIDCSGWPEMPCSVDVTVDVP